MPLPKPKEDESKKDFLKRCMGNNTMNDEYPERDQRFAVCNTQWRNRNKEISMESKLYSLIEVKASKEEDRVIDFTATSEIVDYDNDIIKTEGMNIKGIKKNKSFLWSHKQGDLPIGKITSLKKVGKEIIGKAQLTSEDEYPFGYTVYKLIKNGYINNVSMSFIPDYSTVEYKEVKGKPVRIINDSTLLEISAVNIGANKNALITSKSLKESVNKAWDDDVIDGSELNDLNDSIDKMESYSNETDELKKTISDLQSKIIGLELQIDDKELEDNVYEKLYSEYVSAGNSELSIDSVLEDLRDDN